MRQMIVGIIPTALTQAALLGSARVCNAQSIWGEELSRGLAPGAVVPYDGVSPNTRYNYYAGPAFYFNGDARRLYLADYYDRLDRAERFGYCPPPPPNLWPTSRCRPSRWHWGVGVGYSR